MNLDGTRTGSPDHAALALIEQVMARAIAGHPDRPEVGDALASSFCRTDPEIAGPFARVTFLSDHRDDLMAAGRHAPPRVCRRCTLIRHA